MSVGSVGHIGREERGEMAGVLALMLVAGIARGFMRAVVLLPIASWRAAGNGEWQRNRHVSSFESVICNE